MPDSFRLYAFGDSLLSGQGLPDEQKPHHLAARQLAAALHAEPEAHLFAHSGATLGLHGEGSSVCSTETPGWREVPVSSPSVMAQINAVTDAPAPHLVLLNGGLNDVDYKRVINPFGKDLYSHLDALIGQHCYADMSVVIRRARERFPEAVLMVVPYYPLMSRDTDATVVGLFGAVGFQLIGASALGTAVSFLATEAAKRVAIWRTYFFYQRQLHWLRRAVTESAGNADVRGPGVLFAYPGFGLRHCLGGRESLLFSTGTAAGLAGWLAIARGARSSDASRLPVEDPLAEERAQACEACNLSGLDLTICKLASIGHPNPRGSLRYAEQIAETFLDHQKQVRSDSASSTAAEELLTLRPVLQRLGLASGESDAAHCWQHRVIDEVSVEIATDLDSGAGTDDRVYLRLSPRPEHVWRLGGGLRDGDVKNDFEPDSLQRFTIDPCDGHLDQRLHPQDIRECTLVKEGEDSWQPRRITLWLNGVRAYEKAINRPLTAQQRTWTAPDFPGS